MKNFRGKVAVVTGAASGIGFALANRFARNGMKVVMADVEEPALEGAVASMRRQNHDVTPVVTDVSKLQDIEALADEALSTYGKVHILCNNAGVGGLFTVPIWETTQKDWQWTLGVNLWGVVNGIRTFVPIMLREDEEGHVVNTASMAGLTTGSRIYGVTKHAVVALSEALYANLRQADAKIGVSVLCPSMVQTKMPYAYRNRPPELLDESNAPPPPAEREAADRLFKRTQEEGMPPHEAAELVLQAIKNDQFWILTSDEGHEAIRARAESIVNRTNPPIRPRLA
ncbi:MAG: SDR family NAD(P)-dependent oxidoreductase [Chloroflexi bacterium]|nr:SDR family NAD(P)-dependent oxidoreductase [Chloroflexota bacterium]